MTCPKLPSVLVYKNRTFSLISLEVCFRTFSQLLQAKLMPIYVIIESGAKNMSEPLIFSAHRSRVSMRDCKTSPVVVAAILELRRRR